MSERSDRNLGFAVMIFLGIFCAVTGTYLSTKLFAPVHLRTIVFEETNSLNFLRIQDPVKVRGVEVGTVRAIAWRDGKTHLEIMTGRSLDIHRGYHIIAEASGFMGDRYIAIEPGPPNAPEVGVKELLNGTFPMGPAEAIAYIETLRRVLDSISGLTTDLRTGTVSRQPFGMQFNQVTGKIDSITSSLVPLLRAADGFLGNHADSLAALVRKADDMSNSIAVSAPLAVATIETILGKTQRLLTLADTLITSSDALVRRMRDKEGAELTGRLIELKKAVGLLKVAVIGIRNEGFQLHIRLGKK